jgi:hypothetical protein
VSDEHSSSRILAEQEELAQHYLQQQQEAEAKDRERAEMQRAWDAVRYWFAPDGRVASQDTLVEADAAVAVETIAHLNKMLAKLGLLDRLAELPSGVEGEELQAWHVAWDILRNAPDNPSEAAGLLGAIRGKPFAPTVRNWVCDGFRIVVEGRWQTGPLCVEGMGSRVVLSQPASEPSGPGHQPAPPQPASQLMTESADTPEDEGSRSTIWYHGGKSYSADGQTPICVSTEMHNVLGRFLDREEAVGTRELMKAGVSNVATVVNAIAAKFGSHAIRRPSKKGDGYFIRVHSRKLN